MGTIARDSGGGNFRPVPPGSYIARCYSVIDMGTQTNEKFGVSAHKLRLTWELFGEDDNGQPLTIKIDGRDMPMTIGKEYTLSLHEKASLRRDLVAWRGKDFSQEEAKAFDVAKLIGAYCLINVTNTQGGNGKTYSNVAGISPLPKQLSATKPAGVHQNVRFDLDDPDMDVLDAMPEWLQNRIKSAPEWDAKRVAAPVGAGADDFEDDVPF